MATSDLIELEGIVKRQERDVFLVECKIDDTKTLEVRAKISGKLRINLIKILEGDSVKVQVSPYDLTQGRIVYRGK